MKAHMFQIKSKDMLLLLVVSATLLQTSCGFFKKRSRDLEALVTIPYYRDSKDDVVSFKLPEGYIDRWVVGRDRFATPQDKLYLHASGVDLKPETEANRKEFEFPASLAHVISFNVGSWYQSEAARRFEYVQNNFRGLSETKNSQCYFKKDQVSAYGLQVKRIDISPVCTPEKAPDDIHFKENAQQHLETVIQCSVKEIQETGIEGKLRPVCTHHFFIRELNTYVHLFYSRAYLPQWQTLEANVKRLLATSLQTNQPSN
jgi:hypothetical protein